MSSTKEIWNSDFCSIAFESTDGKQRSCQHNLPFAKHALRFWKHLLNKYFEVAARDIFPTRSNRLNPRKLSQLLPLLSKTSLRTYKIMYSIISEHSSTSEHPTAMKYYWQSLYSMIGKKRESIHIVLKVFRKECPHFAHPESLSLSEESSSVSAVSGMSSPLSCSARISASLFFAPVTRRRGTSWSWRSPCSELRLWAERIPRWRL